MAGLQYNFFPTDFLYPKKPQPNLSIDVAIRDVVNLRNQTRNQNLADNLEVETKTLSRDISLLEKNKLVLKATHDPPRMDNHGHDHVKRYLKYLSPYPVSWVLRIPKEPETN